MKHLSVILFVFTCYITNAQQKSNVLSIAYYSNSIHLLDSFFRSWERESSPINDDELDRQNDSLKLIYKLFETFYNYEMLDSLCKGNYYYEKYKNPKYIILNNTLNVYLFSKFHYTEQEIERFVVSQIEKRFADSTERNKRLKREDGKLNNYTLFLFSPDNLSFQPGQYDSLIFSINSFKPRIKYLGKQPLYLNQHYNKILTDFLEDSFERKGITKKKFLESYIEVDPPSFLKNTSVLTEPSSIKITFDRKMDEARIIFVIGPIGLLAGYNYIDNKWQRTELMRLWIE